MRARGGVGGGWGGGYGGGWTGRVGRTQRVGRAGAGGDGGGGRCGAGGRGRVGRAGGAWPHAATHNGTPHPRTDPSHPPPRQPHVQGPVALGVKLYNKVELLSDGQAGLSLGAMTTKTRAGRETATAGNAEIKTAFGPREKRGQAVLGGSFMNFRKDVALGGNASAQYNPTPGTTVSSRLQLNSKGAGGLTLRVNSHDQPRLGLSLLVPAVGYVIGRLRGLGGGGGGEYLDGEEEEDEEGEEGDEEGLE